MGRGIAQSGGDKEEMPLPSLNAYGRQLGPSTQSLFDKGRQYPAPTPVLPPRRHHTGMTDMLYADDFPREMDYSNVRRPEKKNNDSEQFSDVGGVSGAGAADEVWSEEPNFVDAAAAMFDRPSGVQETGHGVPYTQEQLRGPATATGLPTFPHRSVPQERPAEMPSAKTPTSASGPVAIAF